MNAIASRYYTTNVRRSLLETKFPAFNATRPLSESSPHPHNLFKGPF